MPWAELVVQCQAGNREAREALVERMQDHVYFYCLKMMRNEHHALDASQEVFIAILDSLHELKDPHAFPCWAGTIVARACLRAYYQEHSIKPFTGDEEIDPDISEAYPAWLPDVSLDRQETNRILLGLVDALPPPQRMCVLLHYYDEVPVQDIARMLEIPEGTVKSRLASARSFLKKAIDRYTAQGIKLYTLSPLSLLPALLQQEAATCVLSPDAAQAIGQAVFAAGAVGIAGGAAEAAGAAGAAAAGAGTGAAAAAAGSGISAVGVTLAIAKAAGGAAVQKAVVAVAGLALAGSVGGGALLMPPRTVPPIEEVTPPPIVETVPPAGTREDAVPDSLAVREDGAGDTEAAVLPVREQRPGAGGHSVSIPAAGGASTPSSGGGAGSGDTSSDSSSSSAEPLPPDGDGGFLLGPEPVPEPEVPEPPPEDVPLVPEPEPLPPETGGSGTPSQTERLDLLCRPDMSFGFYHGMNEEGVHEFDLDLKNSNTSYSGFPLLNDHFYIRMKLSDESRVGTVGTKLYGKAPGTCEVYYYASPPEGPFELRAVAHVTVTPEQPIELDYTWGPTATTASPAGTASPAPSPWGAPSPPPPSGWGASTSARRAAPLASSGSPPTSIWRPWPPAQP